MENKDNVALKSNEYNFSYEDTLFTVLTDNALEFPTEEDTDISNRFSDLHFHMYYELFYVWEGEIVLQLENERKTLSAGDLFIVSPRCIHMVTKSDFGKRFNLNFTFSKINQITDFPIYGKLKDVLSRDYLYLQNADTLYLPLMEFVKCVMGNNMGETGLAFHEFITSFIRLTKNFGGSSEKKRITRNGELSRDHKLQAIINNHYSSSLSLADISREIHLSERQIGRIIYKIYGMNFRDVVKTLKINQASMMLQNSDMNITDISESVGYSSVCSFYRAFIKQFGVKPSEYRKRNKKR